MSDTYWKDQFIKAGAFWYHDGHPKRPNVILTEPAPDGRRRLSNGYFNGHVVQEDARLFGHACDALALSLRMLLPAQPLGRPMYVIGAEKGGIALSVRIAETLGYKSAYAEKQSDGRLSFERFALPARCICLLAEDTITSGGTVHRLAEAARRAQAECEFHPVIAALCDRSTLSRFMIGGMEFGFLALVRQPMEVWTEGENPFTKETSGGIELVPPVKAKTHWHELTRPYD